MEEDGFAARRRGEEAAQWFARLKTLPVSQGTLNDFFAWRRDPDNALAFEEAERFWSEAAKVGDRPSILRAVQEAEARGRTRIHSVSLPRSLSFLAVSIVAAFVMFAAIRLLGSRGETFRTQTGEQRTIALADGSRLNLNVETAVRVNFTSAARRLELQGGEALFHVAHDKARPFTVTAGKVTVIATGTRFDVALRQDATRVTLLEGSVTVRAADGSTVRLGPGQQWRSSAGRSALQEVNTGAVTAWTQGRIVFDNARLEDAVAEINRHGGTPIVLDAPQMGLRRISGSFEAGDTDSFVTAVTAFLPVKWTSDGQGRIHLSGQSAPEKEIQLRH